MSLALVVFAVALTACGSGPAQTEPPKIYYGEDICDECSMIISDERFAAATIVEVSEGRTESRIFDDIGGMFLYHIKHPELKVLARYVHDYETREWLTAEDAFFVHSEDVHSPMAHGVIACKTRGQAERLAGQFNGQVLTYNDLVALAEAGAFAAPYKKLDMGDMSEGQ